MVFCHPFQGRTELLKNLTGRWAPHLQTFVKVVKIIPLKAEKMVLLWLYWDYAVGFFISVLAINEPTQLAFIRRTASFIEAYYTLATLFLCLHWLAAKWPCLSLALATWHGRMGTPQFKRVVVHAVVPKAAATIKMKCDTQAGWNACAITVDL